ncbi:flagellar hook-length control protein FliK [Sporolactobacillus nakayamae]|uniref:Hook-length control protein FliK n=1 Tax=Sporolactobacillus nakayamae TaxID=269670 RepID=A0A1I2NFB5_9BACL|nr:flagellar hook-length control protein FliK [Sporolactobacillus nakayamae]SFG01750.1 hook-length control protein FliK [Sporolactobacillus nakayamae]
MSTNVSTIKSNNAEQVLSGNNSKKKKKGAKPEDSFLSVIHLIQHSGNNPITLNVENGQNKRLVTDHSLTASPVHQTNMESREAITAQKMESLVKKAQSLAAQSGKTKVNGVFETKAIDPLKPIGDLMITNKTNISEKGITDHFVHQLHEPLRADSQQKNQSIHMSKQRRVGQTFSNNVNQSLGESLLQHTDDHTHKLNAVQGRQLVVSSQVVEDPINVTEQQSELLTRVGGKQNSDKGRLPDYLNDVQPLTSRSSLGNQKGLGEPLSSQANGFEQALSRSSETRLIRQGNQASPKATPGRLTDHAADSEETSFKKMISSEERNSTNQTRPDHHRAVSGQMNKLELWATFQSEKNPGKQASLHEQVADHLNEWLGKSSFKLDKNGVQSYTVTLYPEHLGKLVISVSRGEQGLTAQLTAETQKAKDLLEGNLGQLKHDCAGRGIPLTQIDVNRQLHQASVDNSQYQGQDQSAFQQNTDQQEENQKQHRENHHSSAPDQDQQEHSFSEWMTGGVI